MKTAVRIALFFGILFFPPIITNAQVTLIDGVEAFVLVVYPDLPRPNEPFTVSMESNLITLSDAKITFFINGVAAKNTDGTLLQSIAPAAGKTVIVRATAETADSTYQNQVAITPQDAVLVLEPGSTIPPAYKGAALLPAGADTRIVAIPNFKNSSGVPIPPNQLVYSWRAGERQLEDFSGIGKSVLKITGPLRYRSETISAYVTTQDKRFGAYAEVAMEPATPVVRMYQVDPLIGILYSPTMPKQITMQGAEETFAAFPYFFATWPTLSWSVGGTGSGGDPTLTVRAGGAGSGTTSVRVEASDTGTLSVARTETQVSFGGSQSRSFFQGI